ncbi:hypothetical protein TI03_06010, partial [Achromatium sp. WMS1]
VEQWVENALAYNHGIQAAKKAMELAKKSIDKQHSGYYPKLDVVGSYGINDSDSTLGSNRSVGIIGLQFTLALYQGEAVASKERQAVHEYRAAQAALDQQRRGVNRQVRDAYRGILATISRTQALKSAVVSSQTALQSYIVQVSLSFWIKDETGSRCAFGHHCLLSRHCPRNGKQVIKSARCHCD